MKRNITGIILHLAIPASDINESVEFYLKLNAKLGRRSSEWAILNFFNLQLVLHKNQDVDANPNMYPRHFGVIVDSDSKLLHYHDLAKQNKLKFFQECFSRFAGDLAEHKTFFLCDPSNNLIEFKWYRNTCSVFGDPSSLV